MDYTSCLLLDKLGNHENKTGKLGASRDNPRSSKRKWEAGDEKRLREQLRGWEEEREKRKKEEEENKTKGYSLIQGEKRDREDTHTLNGHCTQHACLGQGETTGVRWEMACRQKIQLMTLNSYNNGGVRKPANWRETEMIRQEGAFSYVQ